MAVTSSRTASHAPPLWRNRLFLLIIPSTMTAAFADRLIELSAMPLLGLSERDVQASSVIASIMFCFFTPFLIVSFMGGWIADSFPRRWLMLGCDAARAVVVIGFALMLPWAVTSDLGPGGHWKVLAMLLAMGVVAAVYSPTRNAIIPQVVPGTQLNAANAAVLGVGAVMAVIGFRVAPSLIKHLQVQLVFGIAGLSFLIGGTFFIFARIPAVGGIGVSHEPEWKRLLGAVRYLRRHRPGLELLLLNVLFWGAVAIVISAINSLVKHRYGLAPEHLVDSIAYMHLSFTGGMLLGALWITWVDARHESVSTMLFSLLCASVTLFALAFVRWYAAALALGFIAGLFSGSGMIIVASLMQALTPDYVLGRVSGLREVLSNGIAVLVYLAIWRLPAADAWTVPALAGIAALLAVVTGSGLLRTMMRGPMPRRRANFFWRVVRSYVLVWHRLRWTGKHHIPSRGPVILAANHTTGLDPFIIQAVTPRLVRWVMLTGYRFWLLDPLWKVAQPIALERPSGAPTAGASERSAESRGKDFANIRAIIRRLEANDIIGLFPEGQLQRPDRELQPFAPGIGVIARRTGATIVPVWIAGTPRIHGMLWHFLTPSRVTLRFGKPFTPGKTMTPDAIVTELRRRMIALSHGDAPIPRGEGWDEKLQVELK